MVFWSRDNPSDKADEPTDHESVAWLWDNEILIEPQHLQIGHYVARLDCPWRRTPFPLEGVMISSGRQRSWFIDHCHWLIVDLLRSRNSYRPPRANIPHRRITRNRVDADNPKAPVNMLRHAELDTETVSASVEGYDLIYQQASSLIEAVKKNGRTDPDKARLGIRHIVETLEQNIAAMIWLTRIKNTDEYTAEHCVNVAILSMGLAKSLNWKPDEVEQAGLAGLLHDLGKTRLDPAILNKPERLTREEVLHIRQHSRLGYELLKEDEGIHPVIRQAVLEHHERPDGKGYPLGRNGGSLLPLASLISVVDAYDAMTSHRPYSPARSHHEALGILWKTRGRQFDAQMVEVLIQFLGWITPGTLVRLSDGDSAVVLKSSAENRLWPIVRRLEPDGSCFRDGATIDLAAHNAAHPDRVIRVAEVLPDGALNVDLKAMLDQSANRAVMSS